MRLGAAKQRKIGISKLYGIKYFEIMEQGGSSLKVQHPQHVFSEFHLQSYGFVAADHLVLI